MFKAGDPVLRQERERAKELCFQLNQCVHTDTAKRTEIIHQLIGTVKGNFDIISPFYCDYGKHITIGNNFFYDYEALCADHIFVGAYDKETCIGLAILRHNWNKYIYLYDLKVNAAYREQGVGKLLIKKVMEIAREQGYLSAYTQGQDNNLGACLFYLKNGFTIGGLDTHVYKGTPQEDKKDIFFYYDAI